MARAPDTWVAASLTDLQRDSAIIEDRIAIDKPASQYHLVEYHNGYETLCGVKRFSVYDRETADTDGMRACPRCKHQRDRRCYDG